MMRLVIWDAIAPIMMSLLCLAGDYMAVHILWVYVAASVILAVADALLPSIITNAGFTTYIIGIYERQNQIQRQDHFVINVLSYQHNKSHCEDETVIRSPHHQFLYW